MNDVIVLTGRRWRSQVDEMVDRERDAMGGFGPYERDWIFHKRSPERIRRLLERARDYPDFVAMPAPSFTGVVGQVKANPSSFSPTTSSTETNIWVPAIWTPIPANDMEAGKVYNVCGGGIFSTSSSAPTALWTSRVGQNNSVPPTGISLGTSTATTMVVSLSNVPQYYESTFTVRALGLAASGATATGNGFVCTGGVTTAAGIIQVFGSSVPTTVDNTAATGLSISLTWGTAQASNTMTCQWVCPVRSYN